MRPSCEASSVAHLDLPLLLFYSFLNQTCSLEVKFSNSPMSVFEPLTKLCGDA
jgi:hypothetical protein